MSHVFVLTRATDYEGESFICVYATILAAMRAGERHAKQTSGHEEPSEWVSTVANRFDWRLFDSGEYIVRTETIHPELPDDNIHEP